METRRIITDVSRHAGYGGFMGMSQEAPPYLVEHEGLETRIPGSEMIGLRCGNESARRARSNLQRINIRSLELLRREGARKRVLSPCHHTVFYLSTCSGLAVLLFGTLRGTCKSGI